MTEPLEGDAGTTDAAADSEEGPRCYCPLGGVIDLLGRRYAIQVVCVVGALEPVRYGEIETAFGEVSSSTLSTRLTELTGAGLLAREQYDEIPPRVEYRLTDDGTELAARLEPLLEWVRERDGTVAR
ncbi:winged helix-turn-helix transcriptional regulator [Haloglomus irregulare]|uniref:winged helix-turn-helix transcriptional regulator n=1 Tax=Haloglomus irregulare TaxID=2234134 RepID=UPI00163D5286|nr:helix-turn-helix domain-containing protein [Haloglomus irregulare]